VQEQLGILLISQNGWLAQGRAEPQQRFDQGVGAVLEILPGQADPRVRFCQISGQLAESATSG
jgi:hypothetical protein